MINSDELIFIVTISNHRTLAEAARALNVTPPSVTQRLQFIEKKLSIEIIQRPSRVVSLTEEGILLRNRGLAIMQELDKLQNQLDMQKGRVSGRLSVLAPLGFGNDYVTPLLVEYKNAHPDLEIELALSDNPDWSSHHKWDMVIYIGALSDSSLKMITLAPNQRFVCASPTYLKRHGVPKTPDDLMQHECIALRENNEDVTVWPFTQAHNQQCYSTRITPSLACNEGRVIKDWACAGLGIIMRSEWDVQPEINSGKLVRILDEYSLPDANIVALLSSQERARSARVAGFLDLLKKRLSPCPWLTRSG